MQPLHVFLIDLQTDSFKEFGAGIASELFEAVRALSAEKEDAEQLTKEVLLAAETGKQKPGRLMSPKINSNCQTFEVSDLSADHSKGKLP